MFPGLYLFGFAMTGRKLVFLGLARIGRWAKGKWARVLEGVLAGSISLSFLLMVVVTMPMRIFRK